MCLGELSYIAFTALFFFETLNFIKVLITKRFIDSAGDNNDGNSYNDDPEFQHTYCIVPL